MSKWIGGIAAALVLIGAIAFFYVIPVRVDAKLNAVPEHDPYPISDEARVLHASLRVADLHADTLLWIRDPAKRHARGQTDLPRLRAGGVALQVFTAVTKSPSGLNYDENDAGSDDITPLAIAQRWPVAAWGSLYERAAYQARRLERLEEKRGDEFRFVRSKADLETALADGKLAGLFGIEGAHPLEGELENVDRLHAAGLRVMGLQHFFDNELGGSLHGKSGAGLTDFGRDAVRRAIDLGIIVDLAHSSETLVRETLALADGPFIISHTGFRGHCDSARNISDDVMKLAAEKGALIGVGFWDGAICDATPAGIADAIIYGIELVGAAHIALGSDFDGTVTTSLDASELAALTQALLDRGLDAETIRMVMGENAVRFFLAALQ